MESVVSILRFLDVIKNTQKSKKITLRCSINYTPTIEAFYSITDFKNKEPYHELLLTEDDDFAEAAAILVMLLDYPEYENYENEIIIKNYSISKIKKIISQYTNDK